MPQAANLPSASRARSSRQRVDAEVAPDDQALSAHLAGTIDAACAAILHTQHADGHWSAPADSGPASTAFVLVVLHHLGALDAALGRRAADWLCTQQRTDGSFVR